MNKNIDEILKLSTSEKLLAVEAIWDNIANSNEEIALTDEQVLILEDRLVEYKTKPNNTRSWNEFKNEFLGKK